MTIVHGYKYRSFNVHFLYGRVNLIKLVNFLIIFNQILILFHQSKKYKNNNYATLNSVLFYFIPKKKGYYEKGFLYQT